MIYEKYLLDETMYFKEFEQLKALPKFKIAARYAGWQTLRPVKKEINRFLFH